ncbi:hypothetical protein [Stigmatella aurantiaca]|uniref:Uncharacterized protein n=1 Tax=Stigmatella aurantiaca (strain DW4/3-1) TaxID=378806 RepID=E3FFQ8_STIAD|nr:hypothetical protein [Stigmatella aurantiaca]ADO73981.1 uncharacterized protein STAUR_6224 [Stigmatella aurantiaca DW4/3-1]
MDWCGCPWGDSTSLQKPVEASFQNAGSTGSCDGSNGGKEARTPEGEPEARQACFPQEVAALTGPLANGSSQTTSQNTL